MRHFLFGLALMFLGADSALAGTLTIIHRFSGPDGWDPQTALTLGPDGRLYGTTLTGGAHDRGTVFRVDSSGKLKTLHDFTDQEGSDPLGQLLLASDGYFYGTTRYGGSDDFNCVDGCGMIYRILPSGADFSVQHFMTFQEGTTLQGGLIEGSDGRLYGVASLGGQHDCPDSQARCGTVYAFARGKQKLTVLHTFNFSDGRAPIGRLVQATNGFLYGVTSSGAAAEFGVIYRLKPDGSAFQVLAEFANTNAGCQPKAGLIQSNGRLYGAAEDCGNYGGGALYSVTLDGAVTPIHQFNQDGYARDGAQSTAELLEVDGRLYGTTRIGGLPVDNPSRDGTLFRIGLDGAGYKLLHTFFGLANENRIGKAGYSDGGQPTTGVTLGADGNLYGTTPVGGMPPWPGKGTVYRYTLAR